jgi:lipoprotein LprG
VKVTGKVTADAVNKLIPQLKAGTALPATVWIEKDAPHQLVQATVDQSDASSIQLTLSEWDKPVTVTKPEV